MSQCSSQSGKRCVFRSLLKTEQLQISEFDCPGTPPVTEVEAAPFPEVVLARSGAYLRRDSAGAVYIDRTVLAFFEAHRPYVIEHPKPRPDLSTVVSLLKPEQVCDALGVSSPGGPYFSRSAVRADANVHLLHRQLLDLLRRKHRDELAIEESAIRLVNAAVGANHGVRGELAQSELSKREIEVVVAVAEYLNAHYRQPLKLKDIAAHTGYSMFHLCRLFQSQTRTSVHRYLTHLRLLAATELLTETEQSIVRIALDLGFSSHSHFTAAFTRWSGSSPKRVRSRPGPDRP